MGGLKDLDKDGLGQIFRLGGVVQGAGDQVADRLFVLLDQPLKSLHVALLNPKHEGGIGIESAGHDPTSLSNTIKLTRSRPPARLRLATTTQQSGRQENDGFKQGEDRLNTHPN